MQKVSHKELKELIDRGEIYRIGATIDPVRRQSEYIRQGSSGTMYYTATANMKAAENRLLKICRPVCIANLQVSSNVQEKEGFVYGKKF